MSKLSKLLHSRARRAANQKEARAWWNELLNADWLRERYSGERDLTLPVSTYAS